VLRAHATQLSATTARLKNPGPRLAACPRWRRRGGKRQRLAARGPLRDFVGTVSEAIDLVGQYRDAGIDLLINGDYRNDVESRELFASDVMPHFG
jgi:hypothetical protein